MESDKEEVNVDADVKGDEEALFDQEDKSEEFSFDKAEEDTPRSRFRVKGASYSIKKVLAGKARTKQSSGINRFDRRKMHFKQQALRSTGKNKSVPPRPPTRVESDKKDVGAEGEGEVLQDQEDLPDEEHDSEDLIRKRRRRIIVAVVLLRKGRVI